MNIHVHKTPVITVTLRTLIENVIEDLLLLLDEIDGDESLEEAGDKEPWLGWPEGGPSRLDKRIAHDDREECITDQPHDWDEREHDDGLTGI